ncbi:MAG: hypothetical protein LWX56_10750 [Ignavibacteria bacterium]|nr:hypothetical protein [Ignavibacteria bacterium]
MLRFIFTLDYEILGNGTGSMEELVFAPAEKMNDIFYRHNVRYVNFVETAEMSKVSQFNTDSGIHAVEEQLFQMHRDGFELAPHIHTQWCKAQYLNDRWQLNRSEFNIGKLPTETVREYLRDSVDYLRKVTREPDFLPLSFRAGTWAMQPCSHVIPVLHEFGIRIDSSVFKGGRQREIELDYRKAPAAPFMWKFTEDLLRPEHNGIMIEMPIYTEKKAIWKLLKAKRITTFKKMNEAKKEGDEKIKQGKIQGYLDKMRLFYPTKLDFCKMDLEEMQEMTGRLIKLDNKTPNTIKPIVLIGHSKNLFDHETLEKYIKYLLHEKQIICTFREIYKEIENKN